MRTLLRTFGIIAAAALLGGAGPPPETATPLQLDGSLAHGRNRVHSVTLRGGVEYTFVGACDRDCSDLDLQLFDQNGNLIDQDVLTDDVPVVSVTPEWTGRFSLKVIMASCSVSPCVYRIVA